MGGHDLRNFRAREVGQQFGNSVALAVQSRPNLEVIADLLWRMGGEASQVLPAMPWLSTLRVRSMPAPLVSYGG
jgi:hypothetical protein